MDPRVEFVQGVFFNFIEFMTKPQLRNLQQTVANTMRGGGCMNAENPPKRVILPHFSKSFSTLELVYNKITVDIYRVIFLTGPPP